LVPVRIAAFATMFHKRWITRPDRPDLSAVRSSLLPDEPAPEIFMAMQGDQRLVRPSIRFMGVAPRTDARKRRVNLARQLLRRRDAVVAPSPVPRVSSQRDTGGRSTPSP
jgi:hypothetical protein